MDIKYNRVSCNYQKGKRFELDERNYDLVILEKISGKIPIFERPEGSKIIELIKTGVVNSITVEEVSRLGRNFIEDKKFVYFLIEHNVNLHIRNIEFSIFNDNKLNELWENILDIMFKQSEIELKNISDRTRAGLIIYKKNGGILGRPNGSNETIEEFIEKEKTQKIMSLLREKKTLREISRILKVSTKTIVKVNKTLKKQKEDVNKKMGSLSYFLNMGNKSVNI